MSNIKVRFAPSPTGFMHIGNTRTALFNWLLSAKLGGRFMIRIDETDAQGSKKEYEDAIKIGSDYFEKIYIEINDTLLNF